MQRLAVLGAPIAHSRSPEIHLAAYRTLGLDWSYERIEQQPATLGAFLAAHAAWRGFSVTAPLKRAALDIAIETDAASRLTGACNTLLVDGLRGWNTDVGGTVRALRAAGVEQATSGLVLGAGATAASALVALAEMGCRSVTVALRARHKAAPLVAIGESLGLEVEVTGLQAPLPAVDVAVSTLPASADVVPSFSALPVALLDADYARGASRFSQRLGDRVVSGLEMLLQQALLQVRIFVHGDPARPLDDEDAVWRAMRAALAAS